MRQRLRVFVSSPGDVKAAREIAALTIERLAQEYARFFTIEPYLWEFEAMVASGHFQDSIEPPSRFDVVVLIVWSRLGTMLPERTAVREYRGIDGRAPVTGTEWEFEDAFHAATQTGAPDLLVYRSLMPASFDTHDAGLFEQQSLQLRALNVFWEKHFANRGLFIDAYTLFTSNREFAEALESHLRKLIENRVAALATSRSELTPKVWAKAPFRGLESYEYEHAPIFFGQDDALSKAMLQLAANAESGSPFLLLLGASGSGKSSLVNAGIVPKLFVPRRIPGVAFNRWVVFRPSDAQDGEDLFEAFARRLTTQTSEQQGLSELIGHGQSVATLAAHFRHAAAAPIYPIATALGALTIEARRSGRMLEYECAKLVLVIDQLEELFNNERIPGDDRRRFVELLAGLAHAGQVWIIATMRKDFWHRADETPELVRLSDEHGRLELLPPGPAQLSQMIRRPAEAAGIQFEVHGTSNVPLNEAIAEEVAREPGALPLLSYLLDQLYRIDILQALGSSFTYDTYERLGKLEGAIATQAEAVLEGCTPDERAALGSVLFSLVDMGAATGDIDRAAARRIPLATFQPGTAQHRLIDALLNPNARLLVSDTVAGGVPTVRLAHEALISRWARAREFVQSNADVLKIRHRIEERYALWCGLEQGASTGRSTPFYARIAREQGLLSDIDLLDGQRLLEEHRADTEPHLIDFIERSRAYSQRLRVRTLRILASVVVVVTTLAILASVAGWIASRKQHEAEYQADQTLQSQARLLTEAATQRLKDADVPVAQGIILEVLTNSEFAHGRTSAAFSAFQDIRAADTAIAVLEGHSGRVTSAAYSPDGTRIVSASRDKSMRVWDAATGLLLATLLGHGDRVNSVGYSPDGQRIVSASSDKTARVWDTVSGAQLLMLSGHDAPVNAAVFSSDGNHVVTASVDKSARIWDARTGAALLVLKGHDDAVTTAAYSPDATRVVTASGDKTARIWDARTGATIAVLTGHTDSVSSAAYSADGRRIVTASADKTIRIWDPHTGAQLAVLTTQPASVFSAAFSPDGSRIVSTSLDRVGRVFDAQTGELLDILTGHSAEILSAVYSPDASRIVTASNDKTVRIWDGNSDLPLIVLSGHEAPVFTAAYSPDGTRIVTASPDKTARIWDARTGALLTILSGHTAPVQAAAFSPDGSRIVTASSDKTARIWDARTGTLVVVLNGHDDGVDFAEYSPDGAHIVTASFDKTARIWDAVSGAQISLLSGHGGSVNTAMYSPDGTRIVSASADKTARIWDAHTGAQLAILTGHADRVEGAAYSPDGTRIVTAGLDRTVRVWDAHAGTQLLELSGPYETLNSAAYSPDGTQILTTSNASTRIWDARSGSELKVLSSGLGGGVFFAGYSPDGTRVVAAYADKTARIWDAHIPADITAQVRWDAAAQFDPLPEFVRTQLGLRSEFRAITWSAKRSACDENSAAFYDPDRVAHGVSQSHIAADLAYPACSSEATQPGHSPRMDFQLGRALVAKGDLGAAKQAFERAAAAGYRAAGIDLAHLLGADSPKTDSARALSVTEKAWGDGVAIAAYELGRRFESGLSTGAVGDSHPQPDLDKAWSWYQKGADAGEPTALARFAERDESEALTESDAAKRNALLLEAFRQYAAAVERAEDQDWPEDVWQHWRHRRATIARLLAHEHMMQQVADAYQAVLKKWAPAQQTTWQSIKAKLSLE